MTVRIRTSDAVTEIPPGALTALAEAVGAGNVLTDPAALEEAGTDWWPIGLVWAHHGDTPALPAVVVRPSSAAEVAAVLRVANGAGIPVTPFAGRSGVCGGSLPARAGISLDLRGLDTVRNVDAHDLVVHVDAGVFGPALEERLAGDGVTVGHFPQSFDIATVGGWIACRGAGQYSNRYGKVEDMVLGLEVALADGTLLRTNPQPASATGPDLTRLFVGAEGTLGVVTSAWLKLWPAPEAVEKRAWSFPTIDDAIEVLRSVLRRGAHPACLRVYDGPETARHFELPDDANALVVLSEGDPAQVAYEIAVVDEVVAATGASATAQDTSLVDHWLEKRNDVSALHTVIERGIVVDTIEVAAPWSKLAAMYAAVQKAVFGVEGTIVCTAHSSHAYATGGCLYFTFAGGVGDDPEAKDRYYRAAWDAAMRAVIDGGGTISHHHGIGLVRSRFMQEELGDTGLAVLTAVKAALDPNGILNPGKLGLGDSPWP